MDDVRSSVRRRQPEPQPPGGPIDDVAANERRHSKSAIPFTATVVNLVLEADAPQREPKASREKGKKATDTPAGPTGPPAPPKIASSTGPPRGEGAAGTSMACAVIVSARALGSPDASSAASRNDRGRRIPCTEASAGPS